MGLTKYDNQDIEFFGQRPDNHVVSGWSPPPTKAYLEIACGNVMDVIDADELKNRFKRGLFFYVNPRVIVFESPIANELSSSQIEFLESLSDKYNWFTWRLIPV